MLTKINETGTRKKLYNRIYSGFTGIDNNIHGWQSGDLIILASCPSCGKTAFALSLLKYAAVNSQTKTVLFSIENPKDLIISRLRTAYGNICLDNIFIDDTPGISLEEISEKIRTLVVMHEVKLVIIDYFQLIDGRKQYWDIKDRNLAREQELSAISKQLKTMSQELDIAIIATFQMNPRLLRHRMRNNSSYEFGLNDLLDNGAIEREADIVMFINRPDIFSPATDLDEQASPEVAILKNRGNKGARIKVNFDSTLSRFDDIATLHTSEIFA